MTREEALAELEDLKRQRADLDRQEASDAVSSMHFRPEGFPKRQELDSGISGGIKRFARGAWNSVSSLPGAVAGAAMEIPDSLGRAMSNSRGALDRSQQVLDSAILGDDRELPPPRRQQPIIGDSAAGLVQGSLAPLELGARMALGVVSPRNAPSSMDLAEQVGEVAGPLLLLGAGAKGLPYAAKAAPGLAGELALRRQAFQRSGEPLANFERAAPPVNPADRFQTAASFPEIPETEARIPNLRPDQLPPGRRISMEPPGRPEWAAGLPDADPYQSPLEQRVIRGNLDSRATGPSLTQADVVPPAPEPIPWQKTATETLPPELQRRPGWADGLPDIPEGRRRGESGPLIEPETPAPVTPPAPAAAAPPPAAPPQSNTGVKRPPISPQGPSDVKRARASDEEAGPRWEEDNQQRFTPPPDPAQSGLNAKARLNLGNGDRSTGGWTKAPGQALKSLGRQAEAFFANLSLPQFQDFLSESGVVRKTAEAGNRKNRLMNGYQDAITGGDVESSGKIQQQMVEYFDKNPLASKAAIKLREGRDLTPEEAQFHQEHAQEYMPYAERFFGFLDAVRETILPKLRDQGFDVGDQGPTYVPRNFSSVGDVVMALGPNWRSTVKSPELRSRVLANLERSRTTDIMPEDVNLAETAARYWEQIAEAQSFRPLGRDVQQLIEHYRSRSRNVPEAGAEADAMEAYYRANIMPDLSGADTAWHELTLRRLGDAPAPKVGDTFKSSGRWRPEGTGEVIGTDGEGGYVVEWNRDPATRETMREHEVQAIKHELERSSPVTDFANTLNKWASLWRVAGRLKSAASAGLSNAGRFASALQAGEVARGDLAEGFNRWREKPSPEKAREWQEQGIDDQSLRSVTENPADTQDLSKGEGILFSNVTIPDRINRIVMYEAKKKQLYREHAGDPSWDENRVRDEAAHATARYSDMSARGYRAASAVDPYMRLIQFLGTSKLREFQLFVDTLKKGQTKAALAQAGISGAMALPLIASGQVDDALDSFAEFVPYIGSAFTHGDFADMGAPGIILKGAHDAAHGNIKAAAPGFIRQFLH